MVPLVVDEAAVASMRPRLITAENHASLLSCTGAARASMRPRLITAENGSRDRQVGLPQPASMRPRLITAENDLLKGIGQEIYGLQ